MITFLLIKLKGKEFILFFYSFIILNIFLFPFLRFIKLFLFDIVFIFILFVLEIIFKKHKYRFWILFGLPGSGKTTTAVDLAIPYLKKHIPVYSNFDLVGSTKIDKSFVSINNNYCRQCAVFIDEAGIDFDNRNFKSNFTLDMLKAFKFHRKLQVDFYFFSQDVDVDLKLRKLCNGLFYVKKSIFPFFVVYKKIKFSIAVDKQTKQLINAYNFVPFSGHYVFMPRTWKKFDTNEIS